MESSEIKHLSALSYLQYILFGGAILYFGRSLFIPLSFALLISFILYPVCVWLEKKGASKVLAIGICITALILFFTLVILLTVQQFIHFTNDWSTFRSKFDEAFVQFGNYMNVKFNISQSQLSEWLFKSIDSTWLPILRNTLISSGTNLVLFLLVPIYAALILFYRSLLTRALYGLFSFDKRKYIHEILVESIQTYYRFIKGMLLVYLIVGILNSAGLLILGVPHAILFGFLAAIMTIIPYVGIIVASLLPIAVSWITFNSIWYPVGVIVVFTFVQYLEANIIFPWAVSNRLQINTLVTLIVIIAGGILWGAAGMILFVPFVAIIKLIADKTEGLSGLASLLGNKTQ